MLVVVSPAKRLDWTERPDVALSAPDFAEDAAYLAKVAARLSKPQLRKLMDISEDLAKLNQARFRAFAPAPAPDLTRAAMYAFAGDTYQGLDADSLDAGSVAYANGHLRILSGLYGLLRPCDAIQPYRLEMGSRLKTRRGATLYAYWGRAISEALNRAAEATGSRVLVNCASQEYFGAVDAPALALPVVTPAFLEQPEDGPARMVSFHAKKARGAMARHVITRKLSDPDDLCGFDLDGYRFDPARSLPGRPVFVRDQARKSAA